MKKITLIVLAALAGLALHAQPNNDEKNATRLDSILIAYSGKNMFQGSVLVAKKGKVLLNKGYGLASITNNIPNKPQTKFRLGSVTKQFTSMAIMILEEQGKLSVNDPLTKYIPDYPDGNKITIHHLLNHSSGMPSITSLPSFDTIKRFPHTHLQLIGYVKHLPLEFEPGTQFKYSNSGYIMLSYIIEKVSGTTYADFITKNIFQKLGMKNSGYCFNNTIYPDFAEGYSQSPAGYEKSGYIDMSIPQGAGGLYSTTEDLYLWDRALYTDQLVKKSTREKIFTPSEFGLGYGWFIRDYNGHHQVFHRGRIEGFNTVINRFTDEELCIIILKNVDNQSYFQAGEIAVQVMFNEPFVLPVEHKMIAVDPSVFRKLAGEYVIDSGFAFMVTDSLGKLYLQATGEPQIEMLPESEWNYFFFEVNATVEFIRNDKGEVISLILRQDGMEMPGTKTR